MNGALRLLSGPRPDGRAESMLEHRARIGPLPELAPEAMVGLLEASGLLGRGGAGFPVGRKWRAILEGSEPRPVIVANGAEGEPESMKDRFLMAHRPHLVIDGSVLAARTLGADRTELYLGREHVAAVRAMRAAVAERPVAERRLLRVVEAPIGYVAGEATAVVHYLNSGDARPVTTPPRMSERGVRNRPTLVQNVESLAQVALLARFGAAWFRERGRAGSRGTALVTIAGPVRHEGVAEIDLGTPLEELVEMAGGPTRPLAAALIGGYFGTWAKVEDAWRLPLDPESLKAAGLTFGCGLVRMVDERTCGVDYAARIMGFLAAGSARQCGPCQFGLADIAAGCERLAGSQGSDADLEAVERWMGMVSGRGACRHPDGAVQQLRSAMDAFGDDFRSHAQHGRCLARTVVGAAR
jgi:NADH:ubiquinone oxidoreductase subunit F (NADH-binding)